MPFLSQAWSSSSLKSVARTLGFTRAENWSIIHESYFHNIGKQKSLFPTLHYLNFVLHFIISLPLRIKYIDYSKICGCKISTVTPSSHCPEVLTIIHSFFQSCAQLKGLHCRISLSRLCLHRCCYCAKDSSLLHHYLVFQPMIFLPFQIETW